MSDASKNRAREEDQDQDDLPRKSRYCYSDFDEPIIFLDSDDDDISSTSSVPEKGVINLEEMILEWIQKLPHLPRKVPKRLPPLKVLPEGLKRKPTLILDLDQTLIYSTSSRLSGYERAKSITVGLQNVWVHPRPGLFEFLKKCRSWYTEMILWTAAKAEYAEMSITKLAIEHFFDERLFNEDCYVRELESIIPPEFQANLVLESELTNRGEQAGIGKLFLKPLCLLNREQCFLVDDSKEMIALNSHNQIIHIPPFTGDINDRELNKLLPLLEQLSKSQCVTDDIARYHSEVKLREA